MAGRIRSIKPETLEDDRPASLSDSAWRLWVSMWLLADDHGNCRANASYIAGQVWWAHDTKPDVENLLAELERAGSITRYRVRSQEYAHVSRWEKHQRVDNAGKPRVPAPEESDGCDSPRVTAIRGSDLRPPTTITTTTTIPDAPASPVVDPASQLSLIDHPRFKPNVSAIYAVYPRKEGKSKGIARLEKQLDTPDKFDACMRAVKNYAAKVVAEGTETKYMKQFDTWAGCWQDYVDYAPGPPARAAPTREQRYYSKSVEEALLESLGPERMALVPPLRVGGDAA